jgi:hypothetical protein
VREVEHDPGKPEDERSEQDDGRKCHDRDRQPTCDQGADSERPQEPAEEPVHAQSLRGDRRPGPKTLATMEPNDYTAREDAYPVQFSVEYPDRSLNRLTTFFRIFVAIPILIVAATLGHEGVSYANSQQGWQTAGGGGTLLFIAPLLMILFRQKYPRWWFDWNLEVARFFNRIGVYLALMDDTYPSTDEHQSVSLEFPYPDAKTDLNRWLPLVKWLLAIPHYIVLAFLWLAAFVTIIFAWFAILFTGRYPRGIFDFLVGVGRWTNRVSAYAFLLVTDRYPPFSFDA